MPRDHEERERIKVTDRRSFTIDGERRVPDAPEETTTSEGSPVRGQGFEMHHPDASRPREEGAGGVDFASFILSLASTAMIHLGEVEDPVHGRKEVNPAAARQLIDIIDMLRQKTRGNLDPREREILDGILAELQMAFASKASARS